MPLLALAPGPIERVRADVAIVPLFAGERPLRAAAGRVDWRLCGRLSHLFAAGRLTGAAGEAVLIPGGGGIFSPRVIGLGAGERGQIDATRRSAQRPLAREQRHHCDVGADAFDRTRRERELRHG